MRISTLPLLLASAAPWLARQSSVDAFSSAGIPRSLSFAARGSSSISSIGSSSSLQQRWMSSSSDENNNNRNNNNTDDKDFPPSAATMTSMLKNVGDQAASLGGEIPAAVVSSLRNSTVEVLERVADQAGALGGEVPAAAVSNLRNSTVEVLERAAETVRKVNVSTDLLRASGADGDAPANVIDGQQQLWKVPSAVHSGAAMDSSGLFALDPALVDICTVPTKYDLNDTSTNGEEKSQKDMNKMLQGLPFVSMFRGSANYIANHRNTLAIYHIPGGLLDLPDQQVFRDLMNDIALTWLLGMKIVLVVGCRHQIERRIPSSTRHRHFGIPVTDAETLRVVKEEAGYVRFEVERQLARSLRLQGGSKESAGPTKMQQQQQRKHQQQQEMGIKKRVLHDDHMDGNVVSGNFYSAQPFGILDGIDYQYTGFVRKVEVDKIRQLHASRDICLLTTLGVSPSGEVFNVNSESLAAAVAGAMDASKVIYFTDSEMELRHKIHGNKIQNLRVSDAKNLLDHYGVKIHKRGFVTVEGNQEQATPLVMDPETGEMDETAASYDMLIKIGWGMAALEQGVQRAHVISPKFGAVLQELYTRDGSGTLISRDLYDGIRRADVGDVSTIHELILPLIKMGTLIDRPKATLEKDIDSYYVFTRDSHIVACGQLKIFEGPSKRYAEIGCLVVNQEYRARGRGDAMLGYLERLCLLNGALTVFVLSTQTMEWFVERGFEEVRVDKLPPSRQATYNHKRASKIYMKEITSARDLDQSELWWNR